MNKRHWAKFLLAATFLASMGYTISAYAVGTADINLAIGTTTYPASNLGVFGNVSIGTSYQATLAPTNGAIIQGNVGIGTTAPANLLDVYGSGTNAGIHLSSATPSSTTNALYAIGTTLYWNGSAVGPAACTGSIGTVCSDGTIIAGGGLYTTPCDVGQSGTQNSCTGTRSTDTWTAAVSACLALSTGGHTDWYLPDDNELNILYNERVAIGGFDVSGTYFWSSSVYDITHAWAEQFSTGNPYTGTKTTAYEVRCVRR